MKLTPGKLAGLKAVSGFKRGVIAAAAMDQRGLAPEVARQSFAAAVIDSRSQLGEFKTLVTDVLTRHASAILLDPEFGPRGLQEAATTPASCSPMRKTGYDATTAGTPARPARRLERPPPQGSRRRLHQDPALLHPL